MMHDNLAIELFREYLRIRTVTEEVPDYVSVETFLFRVARQIGLEFQKVEQLTPDGRKWPIFILTLPGSTPSNGSLLLHGHFDVVPVRSENWSHDPFGAELVDGRIYARGAQDMKCVSIAYLCALDRLLRAHHMSSAYHTPLFNRSVYVLFTSDEEIGSPTFSQFVLSPFFRSLRPAFALDEGICSPSGQFIAYHSERFRTAARFSSIGGTSGHGSLLLPDTAGEKLLHLLDRVYDLRAAEQRRALEGVPDGQLTGINVTMLNGGVQSNVVCD